MPRICQQKNQLGTTLFFLFLWLSFSLQAQVPEAFKPVWDSSINVYTSRLAKVPVVGSSIVFIQHGEIIAESLYGYQDKDTKEPITLHTIYNWGSCTKPFTALAVMQLRDKGLLTLNDPVSRYIPEVKNLKNPYGTEITVAHLLSHTSGLSRWSGTVTLKDGIFYEVATWEAFQAAFPETELTSQPGSVYSYSNLGYDLLGILIERITNTPFPAYVQANILEPLDMKSSYFGFTPKNLEKHRSNNYRGHKGRLESKGKDYDDGLGNPSGGLNAPVTDMIKFMNFLCNTGGKEEAYNKVLTRASLEEMFKPQHLMHAKNKHAKHTHYQGTGFHIINPENVTLIGHEGESRGFMSSFWVNLETKTAFAFAWNTTHRLPVKKDDKLFREINEVVYSRIFPVFKSKPGSQ